MNAIMAALRSGIAPSVVHSMVDVAASALRLSAPGPTPASPPRHHTLSAHALHPPAQHPSEASPVSSPGRVPIQARKGTQSGIKSVLKVRDTAELDAADKAGPEAAAHTEPSAMVDAPYRY